MKKKKLKASVIVYDSLSDTLTARFGEKSTNYSINLHDILIVDISEKNKLAGIEFIGVSELFNLRKSELAKIETLTIKIVYKEESQELFVSTQIDFKDKSSGKEIIIQPIKTQNPIII
jgi:uncharacterized protein YuzE